MIQIIVNALLNKRSQTTAGKGLILVDKLFTNEHGYFNWQSVLAIIGILSFLWGFISMLINENRRYKNENTEPSKKQEKLTEPYNELIRIISLFPNRTPYDVMTLLSNGPNFHSENFDAVNRILEIQIKEDYQKRLERKGLTYQDEEDIKTEIRNREYYIKEIEKSKSVFFS